MDLERGSEQGREAADERPGGGDGSGSAEGNGSRTEAGSERGEGGLDGGGADGDRPDVTRGDSSGDTGGWRGEVAEYRESAPEVDGSGAVGESVDRPDVSADWSTPSEPGQASVALESTEVVDLDMSHDLDALDAVELADLREALEQRLEESWERHHEALSYDDGFWVRETVEQELLDQAQLERVKEAQEQRWDAQAEDIRTQLEKDLNAEHSYAMISVESFKGGRAMTPRGEGFEGYYQFRAKFTQTGRTGQTTEWSHAVGGWDAKSGAVVAPEDMRAEHSRREGFSSNNGEAQSVSFVTDLVGGGISSLAKALFKPLARGAAKSAARSATRGAGESVSSTTIDHAVQKVIEINTPLVPERPAPETTLDVPRQRP